jgi:hypothetical protein
LTDAAEQAQAGRRTLLTGISDPATSQPFDPTKEFFVCRAASAPLKRASRAPHVSRANRHRRRQNRTNNREETSSRLSGITLLRQPQKLSLLLFSLEIGYGGADGILFLRLGLRCAGIESGCNRTLRLATKPKSRGSETCTRLLGKRTLTRSLHRLKDVELRLRPAHRCVARPYARSNGIWL